MHRLVCTQKDTSSGILYGKFSLCKHTTFSEKFRKVFLFTGENLDLGASKLAGRLKTGGLAVRIPRTQL